MKRMSDLVERLRKRAEEDRQCAENSKAVMEALSEQIRLFETREGHNVYAVRMAIDHRNGMERDTRYADDLGEAADRITALEKENAELIRSRDGYARQDAARYQEARRLAIEECARYHDDLAAHHAAAHEHVVSDHHEMMERQHKRDAAAIRARLASTERTEGK